MDDKTKPCGDFYLSILNTNSTNLTNKCIPPPAAEIQKSWRNTITSKLKQTLQN